MKIHFSVAFLASLATALRSASAYHDAEKCTVDFATPAEMVTCFEGLRGGKYDACFTDTALDEFQACMENTTTTADAWECGTVLGCAWDTFVSNAAPLVKSLDACFTNTTMDLINCGMTNLDACSATCGNVYSDDLVLFEDPAFLLVNTSTCDEYQQSFVESSCTMTSCCDSCQSAVLAVHECVANAYLELSCSAAASDWTSCGPVTAEGGRRFLQAVLASKTRRRRLDEEEHESLANHVSEECILMFVNSTSLDGFVPSPVDYLECVYLHYLWMFTPDGVAYVTSTNTATTSSDEESEDGTEQDADSESSDAATAASSSDSSDISSSSTTETNAALSGTTRHGGCAGGGWITFGTMLLSVAFFLVDC